MDLGLADRVFVVTGGTRGLGRATAEVLVAEGAKVVVSARDAEAVEHAAAALGGSGRAVGVAADNADPAAGARLVTAAQEQFGRLDGALVSVGGPPAGGALAATVDQWRTAFESVVLGAVRVTSAVVGALGSEGGAVGLVLSSSVRSPIPGLAISNALRPGLAMWAKTLADELAPRGVRVVSLLPGVIDTDRARELYADPARRAEAVARIPTGRFGEPAEFARVAAFLLSPAASYVTGLAVPVDGGMLRTV